MAFCLSKKNQKEYDKHSKRAESRKATKGERTYSKSWVAGFHNVWDNDGTHDISSCKSSFEKTAFNRGRRFAEKVLDE